MTYGYVRVSSPDQNLDRQIDALTKLAIKPTNIYADKKAEEISIDQPGCI